MTHIKFKNGVIHLKLEETLKVETKRKKQRGRPKENIPDLSKINDKILGDLGSTDFETKWKAIEKVKNVCGSIRKTDKFIKKYKPSLQLDRHTISTILKSRYEIKNDVRKEVKKLIEDAKKNPYITSPELTEAIETGIITYYKAKIQQSNCKHPLGTKATDAKTLNIMVWKLGNKAKESNNA